MLRPAVGTPFRPVLEGDVWGFTDSAGRRPYTGPIELWKRGTMTRAMQVHGHLRVRHRLAVVVAVASLMGVSPCPAQDTSLAWAPASLRDRYLGPAGGARANFVWSVADRFGLDRNNDGFIDLPNTAEYIRPNTFTVTFDATPSVLPRPVGAQVVITNLSAALDSVHHLVRYEWRISGGP